MHFSETSPHKRPPLKNLNHMDTSNCTTRAVTRHFASQQRSVPPTVPIQRVDNMTMRLRSLAQSSTTIIISNGDHGGYGVPWWGWALIVAGILLLVFAGVVIYIAIKRRREGEPEEKKLELEETLDRVRQRHEQEKEGTHPYHLASEV